MLGLTAPTQAVIFASSGSIALLADLIHNFGDAATAIPLGIAFALCWERAERGAGYCVVLAIFVLACVAGYEAVGRLLNPEEVSHVGVLAAAGALVVAGNMLAAVIRSRAGRTLDSPVYAGRRRQPRPSRCLRQPRSGRQRLGQLRSGSRSPTR